jgi:hypothetical protein
MAEWRSVSALTGTRSEVAGEAERCRRQLHRLARGLGLPGATIRLFDPACADGNGAGNRRRAQRRSGQGHARDESGWSCTMSRAPVGAGCHGGEVGEALAMVLAERRPSPRERSHSAWWLVVPSAARYAR